MQKVEFIADTIDSIRTKVMMDTYLIKFMLHRPRYESNFKTRCNWTTDLLVHLCEGVKIDPTFMKCYRINKKPQDLLDLQNVIDEYKKQRQDYALIIGTYYHSYSVINIGSEAFRYESSLDDYIRKITDKYYDIPTKTVEDIKIVKIPTMMEMLSNKTAMLAETKNFLEKHPEYQSRYDVLNPTWFGNIKSMIFSIGTNVL